MKITQTIPQATRLRALYFLEKNGEICNDRDDMEKSQITVIALGGSLIVPHLSDDGGIDVEFLKKFRRFVLDEINPPAGGGRRFVIVAGGGKTCRVYQKAAGKVVKIKSDDLDWIGIASTKLNAELLRVLFQDAGEKVLVEGGLKPGWSTDYIAVYLAQKHEAKEVIIAGDTPYVYEKDPRKFPKAKALPELSWAEYEKLIPKKWSPGLSSPVDPIATKLAKKLKLQVKVLKGTDLANFKKAVEGKKFKGTIIS
jgi:uridylate kinase